MRLEPSQIPSRISTATNAIVEREGFPHLIVAQSRQQRGLRTFNFIQAPQATEPPGNSFVLRTAVE